MKGTKTLQTIGTGIICFLAGFGAREIAKKYQNHSQQVIATQSAYQQPQTQPTENDLIINKIVQPSESKKEVIEVQKRIPNELTDKNYQNQFSKERNHHRNRWTPQRIEQIVTKTILIQPQKTGENEYTYELGMYLTKEVDQRWKQEITVPLSIEMKIEDIQGQNLRTYVQSKHLEPLDPRNLKQYLFLAPERNYAIILSAKGDIKGDGDSFAYTPRKNLNLSNKGPNARVENEAYKKFSGLIIKLSQQGFLLGNAPFKNQSPHAGRDQHLKQMLYNQVKESFRIRQ